MKKVFFLIAILAVLPIQVLASENAIPIEWLSLPGQPSGYNSELRWIRLSGEEECFVVQRDTGAEVPGISDFYNFSDGMLRVGNGLLAENKDKIDSGKYGYVDLNGELVIPMIYDWAEDFHDGLARVGFYTYEQVESERLGNFMVQTVEYGFIDTKGNTVVEFGLFEEAESFSHGLAAVAKYNQNNELVWGFIDTEGNTVVKFGLYETVSSFSHGLAVVSRHDQDNNRVCGYIDTSGKIIIPLMYECASDFDENGLAYVAARDQDGNLKYGFIDSSGELVVPMEYDGAQNGKDGMEIVGKKQDDGNLKYGCINVVENLFTPSHYYDNIPRISEGVAFVENKDKDDEYYFGLVDRYGREIVMPECSTIWGFNCGLAAIFKNAESGDLSESGYIDKTGELVIPAEKYIPISQFDSEIAPVYKIDEHEKERCGFINTDGELVIPLEYDRAGSVGRGIIGWVKKGMSYGIFDNPYATHTTDASSESARMQLEIVEDPESTLEQSMQIDNTLVEESQISEQSITVRNETSQFQPVLIPAAVLALFVSFVLILIKIRKK